jgi:prevent-host-death family protein
MGVVNIHEAKTHLSRLIDEAVNGGDVVIARSNRPLVRLVPVDSARPRRVLGSAQGRVSVSEAFDEPLDDFGLSTG